MVVGAVLKGTYLAWLFMCIFHSFSAKLWDSIDFLKDSIDFLKDSIDFLKDSIDFLKDSIEFL